MPFEKGNKLAKGRPKGALNRSTEMMKITMARAANNTLNTLSEDLEKIRHKDPEKAIKLALDIMEYIIPKLSRTEIKGEVTQRIEQITVNINHTGSESKH